MQRIVYSSHRVNDTGYSGLSPDFQCICNESKNYNESHGITGTLICTPAWYVQVLEGGAGDIRRLMNRILCDRRHYDVSILSNHLVRKHRFFNFGMAYQHCNLANRIKFLEYDLVREKPPGVDDMDRIFGLAMDLNASAQPDAVATLQN